MPGAPAETRPFDRRTAVELIAGFVGGSALFSALGIDTVQKFRDDPGYSAATLQLGVLIGALIGLGLTLMAVWAQRRGAGRRSQRLGRQAWRTSRLPTSSSDRALAIADLERRRRSIANGLPPLVTIVL